MNYTIKSGDKVIFENAIELIFDGTTITLYPRQKPGLANLNIGSDDPFCFNKLNINGLEVRIGALPVDGGKIGFFGHPPTPRRVAKKLPTTWNIPQIVSAVQDLQDILSNLGLIKLE